ncbi:ribose-5-phosphate isomerase [Patescibacteria group bacterium]|nr:ribose-5-phosphate isomerase [Patescibacteria group bacterium]
MKIYLATDHAGFDLKQKLKKALEDEGFEVEDCGAFVFDKDDDYPDFIKVAAEKVAQNPGSFGVVFGKSGQGEQIAANKVKGIRAALGFNEENVRLSREHNNANVLSLGFDFVPFEKAKELIKLFVNTKFTEEERHVRRINKIREIEDN